MEEMSEEKQLLEMVADLLKNPGIQIGFWMGVLSALYKKDMRGKSFQWKSAMSCITASTIMGWVTHKVGLAASLSNMQLYLWIALLSLNTFLVVSILTDKETLLAVIRRFFKRSGE